MADRWWVNADADGDWNNANNWSATEGGAGGAGVPSASDNAYFSDTSSGAACTLGAHATCARMWMRSADHGGTDDYSGNLTIGTYNLICTDAWRCSATATITGAASSDKGLELQGGDCYIRGDFTLSGDFKITMNGADLISLVSGASCTSNYLIWRYSADCQHFDDVSSVFQAKEIYTDSGVTVTMSNRFRLNWTNTNYIEINGIWHVTGWAITFSDAEIVIGAEADFTGDGTINFYANGTSPVSTVHRTTPFSFTGKVSTTSGTTAYSQTIPAWDWSNAIVKILGSSSTSDRIRLIGVGTLKCKKFIIDGYAGKTYEVKMDENNSNIEVIEDIDFGDGGTFSDYSYTRGTGVWTLRNSGSWNDINFDDKVIEAVTIESGAQKNFIAGFNTRDLTVEGEAKFDSTKSYYCEDISGAGTLRSADGNQVTIFFRGDNNFSGVLDNVKLEEYPPAQIPRRKSPGNIPEYALTGKILR